LQARRKRPNSPKKTPISKKSADRDALIDAIASINASIRRFFGNSCCSASFGRISTTNESHIFPAVTARMSDFLGGIRKFGWRAAARPCQKKIEPATSPDFGRQSANVARGSVWASKPLAAARPCARPAAKKRGKNQGRLKKQGVL